jgi:hypothetical protein
MGRTVPTWRMRIEDELRALEPFRRALPSTEKRLFDELLTGVRNRRTAGGMLPSHEVWKPMLLSMIVEVMAQNQHLQRRVEALEHNGLGVHERDDS